MSYRPTVETRAAYRWRTAFLSLGWGWAAGLLTFTALVGRDAIASGITMDDLMGLSVWIVILGGFQAVFMIPGAAIFWVWHCVAPARFARFVPAIGLGALTGAVALLCWWPVGGWDAYQALVPLAVIVGVVTFVAGARYRRGEENHALVQARE